MAPFLFCLLGLVSAAPQGGPESEATFYLAEPIPLPPDLVLEVGGIAVLPDGRTLVCTRRGEIWIVEDVDAVDPAKARFKKFAEGLQEPLGLLVRDGWVYCVQRGELTRLRDTTGDDRADEFETVCDAWSISGNYHEYNFGPRAGPDGDLWITTNKPFGDEPFGRVDWRGFVLRIDAEGAMHPVACGLRSPAGLERSPFGEMFFTDNQGEWCGAGKLSHIAPGDFHGHPWGLFSCNRPEWRFGHPGMPPNGKRMVDVVREMPAFRLPAVWFPYDRMGRSPAGFVWDGTGGRFGPFDGQIFVTDQYEASVMRVTLEQVQGHWQGACYPFRSGLQCGAVRAAFAADGRTLLIGQTSRGWPSKGSRPYGLERIRWTGVMPFEVLEMTATPKGFRLTFTEAVDPRTAGDPASYAFETYTYLLHSPYGSDEVDKGRPAVVAVRVADDGCAVDLDLDVLRPGHVHQLTLGDVRSAKGRPLLHRHVYYTLINIPGGACAQPPRGQATPASDPDFESLFDGKTTAGWHHPFDWGTVEVKDGAVSLSGPRKFFLVSDKTYGDFRFEAEVFVPAGGNSGIQFRSEARRNKVVGYQAEVDTSDRRWSGGLYDEGRRGWIASLEGRPQVQSAFRHGVWNRYRIDAEGPRLRIWLNDVLCTDHIDALSLDGHIALQHHGEKELTYLFRGMRISKRGRHTWAPWIASAPPHPFTDTGEGSVVRAIEVVQCGPMMDLLRIHGGTKEGGHAVTSKAQWSGLGLRFRFRAKGPGAALLLPGGSASGTPLDVPLPTRDTTSGTPMEILLWDGRLVITQDGKPLREEPIQVDRPAPFVFQVPAGSELELWDLEVLRSTIR